MNIHFIDIDLFNQLKYATICKVRIGSYVYGTNNKESDEDFLYIYATPQNELNSFIQTQHQLQYKEENVDYNFTSLHSFLKNIISGDSTINFEVIHSNELKGTELEWLYNYRNDFITYTVIRSYLGFCRRDIKHYYKYSDDYNKTKRLKHIIRGYIYSRDMLNHCFDFNMCNEELRSIGIDISTNKQLKHYEKLISDLRDELNLKLNNKTLNLAQKINVDKGNQINNDLLRYCSSKQFINKQIELDGFSMYKFIDSFENWVSYE